MQPLHKIEENLSNILFSITDYGHAPMPGYSPSILINDMAYVSVLFFGQNEHVEAFAQVTRANTQHIQVTDEYHKMLTARMPVHQLCRRLSEYLETRPERDKSGTVRKYLAKARAEFETYFTMRHQFKLHNYSAGMI